MILLFDERRVTVGGERIDRRNGWRWGWECFSRSRPAPLLA